MSKCRLCERPTDNKFKNALTCKLCIDKARKRRDKANREQTPYLPGRVKNPNFKTLAEYLK